MLDQVFAGCYAIIFLFNMIYNISSYSKVIPSNSFLFLSKQMSLIAIFFFLCHLIFQTYLVEMLKYFHSYHVEVVVISVSVVFYFFVCCFLGLVCLLFTDLSSSSSASDLAALSCSSSSSSSLLSALVVSASGILFSA